MPSVTPTNPCPICNAKKHCLVKPDRVNPTWVACGAELHGKGRLAPPAGWAFLRRKGHKEGQPPLPTDRGFYVYVKGDGILDGAKALTPEEIAAQKAKEEEHRRRSIEKARKVWDWSRADSGRVAAYLAARGIDVDRLGGVPEVLRFNPAAVDWWRKEGSEQGIKVRHPAIVAGVVNARGVVEGVHRTFLDPSGEARKRPALGPKGEEWGEAKKMLGACARRAVRLNAKGHYPGGVLVIAEGIETALSVMAASGYAAWAALSSSGVMQLEVDARAFARDGGGGGGGGGPISCVVIAEDLDANGTGGKAGAVLANRLVRDMGFPGPVVRLAPCVEVAPGLVELEDGRDARPAEGKKKVDWLDVVNAVGHDQVGRFVRAAVEKALAERPAARVEPGSAGGARDGTRAEQALAGGAGGSGVVAGDGVGDEGGDDGRGGGNAAGEGGGRDWRRASFRCFLAERNGREVWCLSTAPVTRAEQFLLENYAEGSSRFGLTYWAGKFWRFDGVSWRALEATQVDGQVRRWLMQWHYLKEGKGAAKATPINGLTKDVGEMVAALASEVRAPVDSMPAWLPPSFDAGEPVFGTSVLMHEYEGEEGAGRASDYLGFKSGAIDLVALRERGEVRKVRHSPSLFAPPARRYDLDEEALAVALGPDGPERDGEPTGDEILERCPNFRHFLRVCSGTHGWEWIWQLQEMIGETLAGFDRTLQTINVAYGPGGTGKSTLEHILMMLVGKESFKSLDVSQLAGPYGAAFLLGKTCLYVPDGHVSDSDEGVRLKDILKRISGGDLMTVRDAYQPASGSRDVRPCCRVWLNLNEIPSQARDESGALMQRMVLLPFSVQIRNTEREIQGFDRLLSAEAAAIAAWALVGYVRVVTRRPMKVRRAAGSEGIRREFEEALQPIKAFIGECCHVWAEHKGPGSLEACTETFDALYSSYRKWIEAEGGNPKAKRSFSAALGQLPMVTVYQPGSGDRSKRMVRGIRLRGDAPRAETAYDGNQPMLPV